MVDFRLVQSYFSTDSEHRPKRSSPNMYRVVYSDCFAGRGQQQITPGPDGNVRDYMLRPPGSKPYEEVRFFV